jgi:hypothetical protein
MLALWVRSYNSLDLIRGHFLRAIDFGVISQDGELWVVVFTPAVYSPRWVWYGGDRATPDPTLGAQLEFELWEHPRILAIWYLVVLFVTLGAVPWLPRRFSLRTLLIATTLVAVVLGLIMALG